MEHVLQYSQRRGCDGSKMKQLLPILMLIVAQGCAGTPAPVGISAKASANAGVQLGANRAEQLARFLAAADLLSRAVRPDKKALAGTLLSIEELGAKPLADFTSDPVPAWRASVQSEIDKAPPFRGRVLGAAYRLGWIDGASTLRMEQLFLGGKSATVAVSVSPASPVSLKIIDADQKTICTANAGNSCVWMPQYTRRYTIEVMNLSDDEARYYLALN